MKNFLLLSAMLLLSVTACAKSTVKYLTVGGKKADIPGFTSADIQTAVDSVYRIGGGIVRLLPGVYEMTGPVRVKSNMSLIGAGLSTVLHKSDGISTILITDAEKGTDRLAVRNTSGFVAGTGIKIFDSKNNSAWKVSTAFVVKVEGNNLFIDHPLEYSYSASDGGTVSNACSLVSVSDAENVTIDSLTIDGNRDNNDAISGHRGGGVYLFRVKKIIVRNVQVKFFKSDGISWQTTEDVTIKNCEVRNCANAGLHPGTGTVRTKIDGNYCHDNDVFGIFVCWNVTIGAVTGNRFDHNGKFGICTGHMDTDMVFENNEISRNGCDGVHFRKEAAENAPHRNVFRGNTVENNGWRNGGYGFSFNSPAEGVIIEKNLIRNTAGNKQKAAVCVDENGRDPELRNNNVSGHSASADIVHEKNPNGIIGT